MVYEFDWACWGKTSTFQGGDPSSDKHIPLNPSEGLPDFTVKDVNNLIYTAESLQPSMVEEGILPPYRITLSGFFRDPFLLLTLFTNKAKTTPWTGTGDSITGDFTTNDHIDYIWLMIKLRDKSGNANHLQYLFDGGRIVNYKLIGEPGKYIREEVTIEFTQLPTASTQALDIDDGMDDGVYNKTGVAEISTIVAVAAASITDSKYFTIQGISATGVRTDYYVWFDKVGDESGDPAPSGYTEIKCDISGDTTAQQVSDTITAAITAKDDFSAANGSGTSTTITVTNANAGDVQDIVDVNSGLTVATSTQGVLGIDGGRSNWDGTYGTSAAAKAANTTITFNNAAISELSIQRWEFEIDVPKVFEHVVSSREAGITYEGSHKYMFSIQTTLNNDTNIAQVITAYGSKTTGTLKIDVDNHELEFTNAFYDERKPFISGLGSGKVFQPNIVFIGGVATALDYDWTGNESTDPSNFVTTS